MDDRFRASDADRDRVAALLRDHFAAGRLTSEELDERLTTALNAQTFGDLRRVLAGLPGPAPVPQHAGHLPPEAGALERGYRRLLVLYPAPYRRIHEEEMLAVLMTAAPAGKHRPGITEAADLIWGGLRVRCQPPRDGAAEPAWRDALAVLSVIMPVIVLLTATAQETQTLLSTPGVFSYGFPLWALQGLTAPLALAALALLRLQRVAALAAVALVIWLVSRGGGLASLVYGPAWAYLFLALGLEIVALAASPGPRRGLQILTWRNGALIVIATLAVSTTSYPVTLIVIAVICAAMALASSLGRWLLVLLAIPAWPFFIPPAFTTPWKLFYLAPAPGFTAQAYLPPLALLALAIIAARRESLRSS
jgi:hypothetical protein